MLTGGVPSIPEFRLVRDSVFTERARRLRDLTHGHAMEEYLRFASALVQTQAHELDRFPHVEVPDATRIKHCREHGLPPLSFDGLRHQAWREGLARLIDGLDPTALPAEAGCMLETLSRQEAEVLERDAANLLAGNYAAIDAGHGPFIGAALQVYWTKMALKLGNESRSASVDFGLCPVCGSLPVVSVVRSGGAEQGLRYLVCSLCASEWHAVRIKCVACGSTKNVSYLFVEGGNDAVRAECCDECKAYLKILYLDRNNDMEALADDLATLSLDVLVDEKGYGRIGPNLLLSPGREA